MKKDIHFPPVENVFVAIAKEEPSAEPVWNVYLINQNNHMLENVTIRSKGYGEKEGQQQLTSTLRHHFTTVLPEQSILIEAIDPALFHLSNEFWVSYFINTQVFDKKFIFVPETIIEENLIFIPQISLHGILHT